MPYVSCPHCGVTAYSAARFSSVDECPVCGAVLRSERNGSGDQLSSDWLLPRGPASVGAARRAIDEVSDGLQPDLLADLRLLVSELVANSVKHGPPGEGTPIALQLSISDESVRVEVHDGGNGFTPPPSPPGLDAPSGRGLQLVDQLADRWGVTGRYSTSVWVELDREPRDEQRAARLAGTRAT